MPYKSSPLQVMSAEKFVGDFAVPDNPDLARLETEGYEGFEDYIKEERRERLYSEDK